MSCSASKSFASEAAQWRSSASRISLSFMLLLPGARDPQRDHPLPRMADIAYERARLLCALGDIHPLRSDKLHEPLRRDAERGIGRACGRYDDIEFFQR